MTSFSWSCCSELAPGARCDGVFYMSPTILIVSNENPRYRGGLVALRGQ